MPLIHDDDDVLIGLPDTGWFPEDGFGELDAPTIFFLLFPVKDPRRFDAVVLDERSRVKESQVKSPEARSEWIWGAFRMPGGVFRELHALWLERAKQDEYVGTLVNAWLALGGEALGVKVGQRSIDVGTRPGYREAVELLAARRLGR